MLVDESFLTGRSSSLGELVFFLQAAGDGSDTSKGRKRTFFVVTLGKGRSDTVSLAVVVDSLLVLALDVVDLVLRGREEKCQFSILSFVFE